MIIRRSPRPHRFTLVPNDLIENRDLSLAEKGLMAYLLSKPDNWNILPDVLTKSVGVSRNTLYGMLKGLRQVGYVQLQKRGDGHSEWMIFDEPDPKNWDKGTPIYPDPKYGDVLINTDRGSINRSVNTEKRARFIPPTVNEVTDYCRQRGNHVDPEAFVAFYESKGWRVGNQKMKSWQSAVITWEKRDGGNNGTRRSKLDAAAESLRRHRPV